MIIGEKKKKPGVVVGFMGEPAPEAPEEMGDDEANDTAISACAEDIISAVEAKDAAGLVVALKAFLEEHDLHEAGESPEEEAAEHAED